MNKKRTILIWAASMLVLPAAQGADAVPFHFWFQRDGGCIACAQMPPPGNAGSFPERAGIDVMFNGFGQSSGGHCLSGTTNWVKQRAADDAASVAIKPYMAGDLNKAEIVSITVAATYASGTVSKTVKTPVAFEVY